MDGWIRGQMHTRAFRYQPTPGIGHKGSVTCSVLWGLISVMSTAICFPRAKPNHCSSAYRAGFWNTGDIPSPSVLGPSLDSTGRTIEPNRTTASMSSQLIGTPVRSRMLCSPLIIAPHAMLLVSTHDVGQRGVRVDSHVRICLERGTGGVTGGVSRSLTYLIMLWIYYPSISDYRYFVMPTSPFLKFPSTSLNG